MWTLRWRMPRQPGRVEIVLIDQPAEEREAFRRVAINVIKRLARIEARHPANLHAFAQSADRVQHAIAAL